MRKTKRNITFLTSSGIALGIGAIALVLLKHWFFLASGLVLLSALIDFLDRKIARKHRVTSQLGKTLDSLNDLISFSVFPVILLLSVNPFDHFLITWGVAVGYLSASVFRLIRFRRMPQDYITVHGLPTTIAGVLVVLGLLVHHTPLFSPLLLFFFFFALSLLMISAVPFKKW